MRVRPFISCFCIFVLPVFFFANHSVSFAGDFKLGPVVKVGDQGTENMCITHPDHLTPYCVMTQYNAEKFCTTQGGKLPSIEQLALNLNPEGMSKIPMVGFDQVSPAGEAPFYYDYQTYKYQGHYNEVDYLWASSISSYDSEFAYIFNVKTGSVNDFQLNRLGFSEVQCEL